MDHQLLARLPSPARYFPPASGTYDVSPGLFPFGKDFGNGEMDRRVFQFDSEFPEFRRVKLEGRAERLGKYHLSKDLPPEAESAVARFLANRLLQEWPEFFEAEYYPRLVDSIFAIHCRLTGEVLRFDTAMRLLGGSFGVKPVYTSAVDALISQVPEDFAVITRFPGGARPHGLTLLHVSSPSHWAPEEKLGLDFTDIHAPVPGFSRNARVSEALVSAMIDKGPYVRFVWSFATHRRLNHHPEPPPGIDRWLWDRPMFDTVRTGDGPPFYLRIERQITWGLPEARCGLFFIRVSFMDGREIRDTPALRDPFISSLRSMTQDSRKYKGVEGCHGRLVDWLSGR